MFQPSETLDEWRDSRRHLHLVYFEKLHARMNVGRVLKNGLYVSISSDVDIKIFIWLNSVKENPKKKSVILNATSEICHYNKSIFI